MRIIYCRFIAEKWRRATAALTLEEEGLLIRISAHCMDTGHKLEDRTTAARQLGVHRNKLEKLLPKLIERGEVTEDATGIFSARAIEEHERAFGKAKPKEKTGKTTTATQGVTQGVTRGVTPHVEAEKSQQILRATLEESRVDSKKTPPPTPSAREARGGLDYLPGQLDLIQDTALKAKPKPKQLPEDFRLARATWNECAAEAGATRSMSPNPAPKLVKQVQDAVVKVGGQENWARVCKSVVSNPFNVGKNDRGWKADLEYVSRPSKIDSLFDKAMEADAGRPAPQQKTYRTDATPNLLRDTYAALGIDIDNLS